MRQISSWTLVRKSRTIKNLLWQQRKQQTKRNKGSVCWCDTFLILSRSWIKNMFYHFLTILVTGALIVRSMATKWPQMREKLVINNIVLDEGVIKVDDDCTLNGSWVLSLMWSGETCLMLILWNWRRMIVCYITQFKNALQNRKRMNLSNNSRRETPDLPSDCIFWSR